MKKHLIPLLAVAFGSTMLAPLPSLAQAIGVVVDGLPASFHGSAH
jgi:hypothetical protein